MLSYQRFIELVEQYDRIAVVRHIHPDYDALGSQAGLVRYLRHRYPEKDIRYGGREPSLDNSFLPDPDLDDPDWAAQALVISVDTSTPQRTDGKELWDHARETILLDHHQRTDLDQLKNALVDAQASSCAEIIALFLQKGEKGKPLEKDTSEALYAGLISDSLQFSINTTSDRTMVAASYLLQSGLDVNALNNQVFSDPLPVYRFSNHLRDIAHYETPGLVWCILEKEDYEPYGITGETAKTKVSVFRTIRHIQAWVLFSAHGDGTYGVSLRSHSLIIRDIAEKYGGGGHDCASGINSVTREQCDEIVNLLKQKVEVHPH